MENPLSQEIDRMKVELYNKFYLENLQLYKLDKTKYARLARRYVEEQLERRMSKNGK